jgi:hypothetical protein
MGWAANVIICLGRMSLSTLTRTALSTILTNFTAWVGYVKGRVTQTGDK